MKKLFPSLMLVILLFFMLTACTVAPAEGSKLGEVNGSQLYVIGFISSAIVYILRVLAKRFPKVVINKEWLSILLYVVAFGLAVVWGGLTIPAFAPFTDPLTFVSALLGFLTALLIALGPSVGFATLIYNLIFKRVLDAGAVKVGLLDKKGVG